ncbi:sugar ABC transporter permease [bacterium]|nr:sugar ABC transporter permease [bacterium]
MIGKIISGNHLQRSQIKLAWVFLAPSLIALVVLGFYPLIRTFFLSFTDSTRGSVEAGNFIGLKNYLELFSKNEYWSSVFNTLLFTIGSVGLEFFLGLGFALLANSKFRARGYARAAMLIPWALPTVVAARMWGWMFNDVFGVINDLLVLKLGILSKPVAWTAQPVWAMISVILVDVWKTTPFVALILLAGLQQIPEELYEASQVDGANSFQKFFLITLPLLKPAIVVALIFRTLDAIRVFDVIWILTAGRFGTESIGTYNYRNLIDFSRLGFGSAISVTIFFIIAIFVVMYVKAIRIQDE